jgi:hypothetical protein
LNSLGQDQLIDHLQTLEAVLERAGVGCTASGESDVPVERLSLLGDGWVVGREVARAGDDVGEKRIW